MSVTFSRDFPDDLPNSAVGQIRLYCTLREMRLLPFSSEIAAGNVAGTPQNPTESGEIPRFVTFVAQNLMQNAGSTHA